MWYKGMDVRISLFVHDIYSSGDVFSCLFKILIFYIEYFILTQSQNHSIILHYIYKKEEREKDNNLYKL